LLSDGPVRRSKYKQAAKLVPIYYMMPDVGIDFTPTEYVDITDEIEMKLDMLRCHESQIGWLSDHDGVDVCEMIRNNNKYYGYQCGAEYAEGFRPCQVYLKGSAKRLLP